MNNKTPNPKWNILKELHHHPQYQNTNIGYSGQFAKSLSLNNNHSGLSTQQKSYINSLLNNHR